MEVPTPGETANVDVNLDAGRVVQGHLRHADDTPATNLWIWGHWMKQWAPVGADGRFVLRNVPCEEVTLAVARREAILKRVVVPAGKDIAPTRLDVVVDDRTFRLTVAVMHADGAPLAGGRIDLTYTDAGLHEEQTISEHLSGTGEHVFEHLRSGKATLVVNGPGVAPYSMPFEVTEPRRLEVRLPEGRIAGRAVAKDGRPVRINVRLSTMIDMGGSWTQGSHSDAVETDRDGRFAFSGVGPGRFDFRFSPEGLAVLRGPDEAKAGDTDLHFVVGPESEVPRQHIVVTLLDARTGTPAKGAGVGIPERWQSEEGLSDVTGWSMMHFDARKGAPPGTFVSESLKPGEYELATTGEDYVEKTVKGIHVEENRDTEVTIRLEPVRKLRGRVVDSEGRPVAGARVSVAPMAFLIGIPRAWHAETDADGAFAVRVDWQGDSRLTIRGEYVDTQRRIPPQGPDDPPITVTVACLGCLRVRFPENLLPEREVKVVVRDPERHSRRTMRFQADSLRRRMERWCPYEDKAERERLIADAMLDTMREALEPMVLRPGKYRIEAFWDDRVFSPREVVVKQRETLELAFDPRVPEPEKNGK